MKCDAPINPQYSLTFIWNDRNCYYYYYGQKASKKIKKLGQISYCLHIFYMHQNERNVNR